MLRLNILVLSLLAMFVSTAAVAAVTDVQEEIEYLEQKYARYIQGNDVMGKAAQAKREEIIDEMLDIKAFTQALPYLRVSYQYMNEKGIKGKRKGVMRFRFGRALRITGYFEEALPLLQESCERGIDKKGERHRSTIKKCIDYAVTLSNLGRHDEAIPLLEKGVEYRQVAYGENHGKTAGAHMQLGASYNRAGKSRLALKHLKIALLLFVSRKGSAARLTNITRLKLAKALRSTGQLDKSERVLRKAYTEFATIQKNQNHPLTFNLMTQLGRTLMVQGRYIEAEQLLKEGIARKIEVLGTDSNKTIQTMLTLTKIYLDQKKYTEAEKVLQAIAIVDGAIKDVSRLGARRNIMLAGTMLQMGKLDEAEKIYAKIKTFLDTSPDSKNHAFGYNTGKGRLHYKQQQYAKADPYLREAVRLSVELSGINSPKTSKVKSYLAQNYAKAKNFSKAVSTYREVMESNASFLANRKTFSSSARAQQEAAAQRYLLSYMKLMVNAHLQGIEVDAEPVSESFAIAENSRSKSLQTAMLGQTARAAARNEYLSDLVRKEQDLRVQLGQLEEQQLEFVKLAGEGSRKRGQRLEEQRRELTRELRKIGEEMSYQYPEYNRLVNPQATGLADVQKLLAPGELILAYFVQKERTLIWAIDKDKASLHVSKLAEKDIYARVQRLRASLDVPIATVDDIPAYDINLAHELYDELIAPVGEQLTQARHLILVPHKALLSMPFGALVTTKTDIKRQELFFSEYKGVPWLAQNYAISVMPSATALVTMRQYARREPAEEPFIGFGDPVFTDQDDRPTDEIATRGIRVAQRAAINTRSIKGLPNLPETREELKKIALTLGASEDNLYFGKNATESNVKNADLKNYRVIAFATHGLVAGDLDGLEQPALALTPPEQDTEEDDGLLQMGEVLGLELNADWVVLSACNTASGDKSLANEGLTGLTQAFFYAGSRALLVSLWPVESSSTQKLTTTMFGAARQDVNLGRAASLQMARKRLIEGPGYMQDGKEVFSYAHPIFWSAFIAVGEGGVN